MNGIDIFIYVIFAAAAILGYARGVVRQAGSIAAVVVGILAARMFGPWATEHLFAGATEPEGSSNDSLRSQNRRLCSGICGDMDCSVACVATAPRSHKSHKARRTQLYWRHLIHYA